MTGNTHYQWRGGDLLLHCAIQPRASKDEIVGLHDGRLKIRLTAPPVDGKANDHLQKFIAKQFGVSKGRVILLQGDTSRCKTLLISVPANLPAEAAIKARDSGV